MKYMAVAFLCAVGLAAHAATLDYTVAAQADGGFDVYQVTRDAVSLVPGSPFGRSSSTQLSYVWTDGTYIYAVNKVAGSNDSFSTSEVVTYQMVSGVPKQVDVLQDNSFASACGGCQENVKGMSASPDHLFLLWIYVGNGSGTGSYVHLYHRKSGGGLSFMCDISVPESNVSVFDEIVTNVHTDVNEIYGYVEYDDPVTASPVTAIYDISTSACKHVGTVPR